MVVASQGQGLAAGRGGQAPLLALLLEDGTLWHMQPGVAFDGCLATLPGTGLHIELDEVLPPLKVCSMAVLLQCGMLGRLIRLAGWGRVAAGQKSAARNWVDMPLRGGRQRCRRWLGLVCQGRLEPPEWLCQFTADVPPVLAQMC